MPRSTRSRRGPRPRYRWFDRMNASLTTLGFGTEALVNLFENHLSADLVGLTAVRLLMRMSLQPLNSGSVCEWQAGMTRVSGDAFSGGAVPDPGLDNHDWWWYDGDAFDTVAGTGPIIKSYIYDFKMNRRLGSEDFRLAHILRNTHTSDSLVYGLTQRLLCRLP